MKHKINTPEYLIEGNHVYAACDNHKLHTQQRGDIKEELPKMG